MVVVLKIDISCFSGILIDEHPYPVVHLSSGFSLDANQTDIKFPSKCSVLLLSGGSNTKLVSSITSMLNQIPTMVVVIDWHNNILSGSWGLQPGLWVRFVPGQNVVDIICPAGGQVLRQV